MIGFPKRIATKQDYYNIKQMVINRELRESDFKNYLNNLLEDRNINIPILEKADNYIMIPHNPELTLEDVTGALNIETIQTGEDSTTKITFAEPYAFDVLIITNKNCELGRLGIDISEIMEVYNWLGI